MTASSCSRPASSVVTEIDGGLGSDTFFVGGNPSGAPVAVISNDFKGHSGIILHSIETGSATPSWLDVPIEGISVNVGDNEEDFVLVARATGSHASSKVRRIRQVPASIMIATASA